MSLLSGEASSGATALVVAAVEAAGSPWRQPGSASWPFENLTTPANHRPAVREPSGWRRRGQSSAWPSLGCAASGGATEQRRKWSLRPPVVAPTMSSPDATRWSGVAPHVAVGRTRSTRPRRPRRAPRGRRSGGRRARRRPSATVPVVGDARVVDQHVVHVGACVAGLRRDPRWRARRRSRRGGREERVGGPQLAPTREVLQAGLTSARSAVAGRGAD